MREDSERNVLSVSASLEVQLSLGLVHYQLKVQFFALETFGQFSFMLDYVHIILFFPLYDLPVPLEAQDYGVALLSPPLL